MPNEAEKDTTPVPPEYSVVTPTRLRPRWQRWLLWSSVRLLILMGVGAGVGTVQWRRTHPPDLMAHVKRIASIAKASGYHWTSTGELRLFRHARKGTESLRWNQTTQTATVVEMLKPVKGQAFVDPARNIGPHMQAFYQQDKQSQIEIIEASNHWQAYTPGKPRPNPDYVWRIKSAPNVYSTFTDMSLSPDGSRIAYKCLMPRLDWRDEFWRRVRRGYQAPFRGQGAAILVSTVDGARTDVIGTVKEDMPASYSRYSQSGTTFSLQSVYWCPDGRHLSFAYGDGVYEVSVK